MPSSISPTSCCRRIRAAVPDVSFTIVGRNPGPRVRDLATRPGIVVTGTVEDVRPWIGEAAVYVVPLRAGSGTRLKIFEALAMGKAVVSTTVGAEGLGLEPAHHFVPADDPGGVCERRHLAACAMRTNGTRWGAQDACSSRPTIRGRRSRALSKHIVRMSLPKDLPTAVLICHERSLLDREGLASWLASRLRLAGLIIIRDERGRLWRAARREIRRVGLLGFVDVVAFRLYARLRLAHGDAAWEARTVEDLRRRYPVDLEAIPHIRVSTPNGDERSHLSRARAAGCRHRALQGDPEARHRRIAARRHVRVSPGHLPRVPQRARLLLGACQPVIWIASA